MKTRISCDERVLGVRHEIYVKLFWAIIIGESITYSVDAFLDTELYGTVLSLAPAILFIWMAKKGVIFNGDERFPRWCWVFSASYALLNTIMVFAMSHRPENRFYLESEQRVPACTLFYILYFLTELVFFYCIYRIARRKFRKLSEDD